MRADPLRTDHNTGSLTDYSPDERQLCNNHPDPVTDSAGSADPTGIGEHKQAAHTRGALFHGNPDTSTQQHTAPHVIHIGSKGIDAQDVDQRAYTPHTPYALHQHDDACGMIDGSGDRGHMHPLVTKLKPPLQARDPHCEQIAAPDMPLEIGATENSEALSRSKPIGMEDRSVPPFLQLIGYPSHPQHEMEADSIYI